MGVIPRPNLPSSPYPGSPESQGNMLNAVDFVVGWARANSLWPLVFGTSCCAIEMMAAGASHNDWARFGLEVARATPRQADLIVLAGTLVEKMGSRLITLYEQMPGPKFVIAMGACTVSGGPFYYDSYSVIKGADRIIPVDVYIPGCPPRPESLLYGIMQLQEIIRAGGRKAGAVPRPLHKVPATDSWSDCAKAWDEKEKAKQEEMKEAQERFKKENPDYKGVVIKRVPVPKFDEVPRAPKPERGLPATEIWSMVEKAFPAATVHGLPVAAPAPKAPAVPAPAAPATVPEATATAPAAVAPVVPPAPLTIPEKIAAQGPEFVLDVAVKPGEYRSLVRFLKEDPRLELDLLIELTAVDWKDRFDVVAHFLSVGKGHKVFVRCSLPHEAHPEIDSLSGLYAGADWHEREVFDFFGIRFAGHPDLRRLFLEDDFPGHPLRKDFEDPTRVVKRPY